MHQGEPPGSLPSYEQRGAVRYSELIVSFTRSCSTCNLHRASNRIPRQSARHRKTVQVCCRGSCMKCAQIKQHRAMGMNSGSSSSRIWQREIPGCSLKGKDSTAPAGERACNLLSFLSSHSAAAVGPGDRYRKVRFRERRPVHLPPSQPSCAGGGS